MNSAFFTGNRARLRRELGEGEIALFFAGRAPRQSADQYYDYFANRNFVYLTGLDSASAGFVLWLEREREAVYILPPDPLAERWTGRRVKPDEAALISGVTDVRFLAAYAGDLHRALTGGAAAVWLDLFKNEPEEPADLAHEAAARIRREYPHVGVRNSLPCLRRMRTIKQPCEIEAIRRAVPITRAGILAMMRASRPGMYEYQYKAAFDHALAMAGAPRAAFPSIIAAGQNNFCIHYYDYAGQAQDGDMILNDVGAQWDGLCNDVSRGWPCNGRFSQRQRLLYQCAYDTSERLFSLIRPGMPMAAVDQTIHAHCGQLLVDIGLLDKAENERRYMWHGGAHHIGWDVHDVVAVERGSDGLIRQGMVFCVDVGIYVEEWGIGFRLEDNCLVTQDGCENLTRSIPRSIAEIEDVMAGR